MQMKYSKRIGLLIMTIIEVICPLPSDRESRSATAEDRRRMKTYQSYEENSTSLDILDIRTPPKVKEQRDEILKRRGELDLSHVGIAFPVDENIVFTGATTEIMNIHAVEHQSTIETGLSSWILLNGLSSTSTPLERNNVHRENSTGHIQWTPTVINTSKPKRVPYPHFKKLINVTSDKVFQKLPISESTLVKINEDVTNLTRIKASELNIAVMKKNSSQYGSKNEIMETSSQKENIETQTLSTINSIVTNTSGLWLNDSKNFTNVDYTELPGEAKDVETDLVRLTKKKKNSSKRKKNKNRRRKPAGIDNNTSSVTKPTKVIKQNLISNQIYNYLSREVMPTVGVGLVGLMVTAGLASYFFYPFGIARRSYNMDKKGNDGDYYYRNELSVPEEEAIGKVIAGMSKNTLFSSNLKQSNNEQPHSNTRYRLVDEKPQAYKSMHGSVENVPLTYDEKNTDHGYYNTYQTIEYRADPNKNELLVTGPEKIKNGVTPVTVPEHGPRRM